jgi:hypothetical protein
MQTFIIIIGLILTTFSCKPNNYQNNGKRAMLIPSNLIQTSSGQLQPYEELIINHVVFQLVLKGKDTSFISTRDQNFITPEGYKIGIEWSQISMQLRNRLITEPGFAYYIELPSGWKVGFCEGLSCTDGLPTDTSDIKFIFKRK